MFDWVIFFVLLFLSFVSYRYDPRTLRTGVLLLSALFAAALAILEMVLARFTDDPYQVTAAWSLLAITAVVLLTVVTVAIFLVLNGVVMMRRERRSPAHLLSLLFGLALLAYVSVSLLIVRSGQEEWIYWVIVSVPLAGYLGFVFTAYVLYAWVYGLSARWFATPAAAVIVLGAGLNGRQVTPLLANRLRRGLDVYRRSRTENAGTVIITSGGQGPDEEASEAQVMSEWLIAHGVPSENVILEEHSRNTEQNLAYSRELLDSRHVVGPVAVVSSNYHAFRAALLMRRAGMNGYAIGAPTARYYWPSATIREFLAVVRDHAVLNGLLFALSCVPMILLVIGSFFA